ncbi:hypothetical protein MHYP_G00197320 [Metynnis hypsauchen]
MDANLQKSVQTTREEVDQQQGDLKHISWFLKVRVSGPPSLSRVRSGFGVNGKAVLEDHGRMVTLELRTALLTAVDAACHCLASG